MSAQTRTQLLLFFFLGRAQRSSLGAPRFLKKDREATGYESDECLKLHD